MGAISTLSCDPPRKRETTIVRCVNPLEDPAWDARVRRFPAASVFHGQAWARALHACYGFAPRYLVGEGEGGASSILPLMEVSSWLTGRRGVSLPFTDECAPLGEETGGLAELLCTVLT